MDAYLQGVYVAFKYHAWHFLYVSAILFVLEIILPASKNSLTSRVRGTINWMAYTIITVSFFTVFNSFWSSLNIPPLLTIDFSPFTKSDIAAVRYASYIIAPIFMFAVFDFFYYWFHRLQHTSTLMWRFHEVHHSIREMNAFNSYHHWTEEILRIPFVVIPSAILFKFEQGYLPAIVFTIIGFQGIFEHSNTKLNLGAFRYIVADNRFHRIHHSIERRHWDKNFGSFCPIWDILFRTAVFPAKGQWPEVGVDGVDEPKGLRDFLFMPFRRRKDKTPSEEVANETPSI